jgi:WD40 repeat protein
LWQLATGRCLRTFENLKGGVSSAALSPSGCQILAAYENDIRLWDLSWLEEYEHSAPFFYSRGVTGSEATKRKRVHANFMQRAGKLIQEEKISKALDCLQQARGVSGFEKDRETIDLRTKAGAFAMIKGFRGGWLTRTFEGHSGSVYSIAFSPNGCQAVSGSADNTLKLWDLRTGECLRTFKGHTQGVRTVTISPNGQEILSGSDWDHTLKLWDAATGRCLRTFEKHRNWVYSVAFSPDGYQALSGSWDHTLKLWNPASEVSIRTLKGHKDGVWAVAFSPDGRRALSGSIDKTLKLWDLATGKCLHSFEGQKSEVLCVAFSPDGRYILWGSRDKTITLLELTAGRRLQILEGHTDEVVSVAFSPTGHHVLSGSKDRTLKLWDMITGNCFHTFEGHEDGVRSVAFSQNGCQILSGSEDHTLKLWDLDWVYEFPGWQDWDEGAHKYLEIFLTLHIPHKKGFRRARELTQSVKSIYTEEEFQQLITELGHRGYGWLRPKGVRRKLEELVEENG